MSQRTTEIVKEAIRSVNQHHELFLASSEAHGGQQDPNHGEHTVRLSTEGLTRSRMGFAMPVLKESTYTFSTPESAQQAVNAYESQREPDTGPVRAVVLFG